MCVKCIKICIHPYYKTIAHVFRRSYRNVLRDFQFNVFTKYYEILILDVMWTRLSKASARQGTENAFTKAELRTLMPIIAFRRLSLSNLHSAICDRPREKGPFDAQIVFSFFTRADCLGSALSNDAIGFYVANSVYEL